MGADVFASSLVKLTESVRLLTIAGCVTVETFGLTQ
jgi:hypothetical protein